MSKHERDSVCHDVSFRSLGGLATWCWHCNMNSGDTADQVNSSDTTATKSQVSLVRKKSPLTHLVHHDDHDMRWAGGLTIGQLEMSLDSHYIVKKQKQLSKPVFNRSHPKRNSTTPAIAVISSLVGRSAKPWQVRGGQLHSSSWSVGVVLISWQAGPGCRLHWHLHLSLSPPFLIEFLPFSILLCGQLQVQEVQVVGGWHPLPHLLVLLVLPLLLAHPASMHLTPAVPPAVWDSCCIYPHLASKRFRLATDAVLFSDCWLVKDNRLCDNTDWERQVSYSLRNFHPDLWQAVAQENEAEDYSW